MTCQLETSQQIQLTTATTQETTTAKKTKNAIAKITTTATVTTTQQQLQQQHHLMDIALLCWNFAASSWRPVEEYKLLETLDSDGNGDR
jgi:hypothetical protein